MNVSMVLEMVDRFSGKTNRINQSMTRMSKNGERAMNSIRRASKHAYNGIDKLGNRYTAFIGGAGGALAIKNVTDLETRLTRLGIQANRTADEIEGLRSEIVKTAQEADIRIDPSQLLNAMDKIIEKTGDFELARGNLRNIGLAIQATGAEGGDIGAMIADLSEKFDIKKPEELFETLDLLTNQGKAGAFTLQNFAAQGERITAAYAPMGRVGKDAAREMGAMLQVIRKGTGSAEQSATAFEALLATLSDAKKRKILSSAGVQLVDPEDPKRMRAINEIVKDIMKVSGGNTTVLSEVFDREAMRALNILSAEYQNTGSFGSLDGFMQAASDGSALINDSARAANDSAAKLGVVTTALQNGIYNTLQAPLNAAASGVASVEPSTMDNIVGYGLGAATILGGAAVGVKGHKFLKSRLGRKGGGIAGALGGVAAGGMGAQPVFVTNWPGMGGMGGAGGLGQEFSRRAGKANKFSKIASKAGKVGRFAKFGKGALKAVPYLGAGLIAADIGSAALSNEHGAMGEALGSTGGTLAGMALGAGIGSVVPVIGTAIGAAIGGALGSFGGGYIGRMFAGDNEELKGKIEVKVDAEGRTRVSAAMNNRGLETAVDQGVLMGNAL